MGNEEIAKLKAENKEYESRIAGLEFQLLQHWTEDQSRLLTALRRKLQANMQRLEGKTKNPQYSPYRILAQ